MYRFFAILALLSLIYSCKKDNSPEFEEELHSPEEAKLMLVSSSNEFGIDLLKSINQDQANENVLISPLSINMCLGMALNGANGNTATEMRNTLGFGNMSQVNINGTYRALLNNLPNIDPKVTVNISNSIWPNQQYNILQSFIDTNINYFDAEVNQLDFSDPNSKNIINQWVNDATEGKINKIIDRITSDDVMFLVNAVYFLADWKYEFDPDDTYPGSFNLNNNSTVQTDMMLSQENKLEYYSDSIVNVISLPYGDSDNFHFVALMPANNSIDQFINNLAQSSLDQWINMVDKPLYPTRFQFPKFETQYKIKLNEVLKTLGMNDAFNPNAADFSKIAENLNLFISNIAHKTYMKLDEQGTEAAAVTSTGITTTSAPQIISFNQPFVYLIREKETGAILFIGKMVNPNQ